MSRKLAGQLLALIYAFLYIAAFSFQPTRADNTPLQLNPILQFTFVPRYGDYDYGILHGRVLNVDPLKHRVVVYIHVNGAWWIKPFAAYPTVAIRTDSSWSCDITTGGVDNLATTIAAFAIPESYSPPIITGGMALPDELYTTAVAYAHTTRSPDDRLLVLNYGPFRAGQSPGGPYPTPAQIAEDIALMAQKVQIIRIYSSQGISETIVNAARSRGVQVVLQAWIDGNSQNNQQEIDAAVHLANTYGNVIAVIVGSEVLMRGDVSEATLIGYLEQVGSQVSVPVGYADDDYRWLNHPNLLSVVDWVGLDLYGFWNCKPLAEAAQYTRNQWQQVRDADGFENKRILVMETGWPNAGYNSDCSTMAIGTEAAQAQFVSEMLALAEADGMDLFLFEMADELWKCTSEPIVGCHWGLIKNNRDPWLGWNELADIAPMYLLEPASGAVVSTDKPTFRWSEVDNAAHYTIQIDDDSSFASPLLNASVTTTSYTPVVSLSNGLYYWRAQAHWGNWSESRSFTITFSPAKAAPQRYYYTTVTPTLCWSRITWAAEYELQVDDTSAFSVPLEDSYQLTANTLCQQTKALTPDKHYWRVRAKDARGRSGGWSAVETFVIAAPWQAIGEGTARRAPDN